MKTRTMTGILIVALVALSAGVAAAQYGPGGNGGDGICDYNGTCVNFVDADGDGVCDNIGIDCPDDDSDGIPNGQDDDYVSPRDGSGRKGRN